MQIVVDKIEKSLRDRHPEVKFKTIYWDLDHEYFICVDKDFLDSEEGKNWFHCTKKVCSDIGITNIFITPWKNPDRK